MENSNLHSKLRWKKITAYILICPYLRGKKKIASNDKVNYNCY